MENQKLSSSEINNRLLRFLSKGSGENPFFELKLYCILNKDGTIRWAIPSGLRSPLFLKTYNPINVRSYLIYKGLRLIHIFGLYKYISKEIYLKVYEESILSEFLINNNVLDWSLFFGTAGKNRKIIIIIKKKSGISFVKIGLNKCSVESIENERNALIYLKSRKIKVPEILSYNSNFNSLELSDLGFKRKRRSNKFSKYHFDFIYQLHYISNFKKNLKDTEFYFKIQSRLNFIASLHLNKSNVETYIYIIYQHLKISFDELSCLNNLSFGPRHGDFTPWNVYLDFDNKEIRCLDWEFFEKESPLFYDFFHFKFQSEFLNCSDNTVYSKFLFSLFNELTKDYNYSIDFSIFTTYFKLYLIDVVSKNLVFFLQSEEKLHEEAKSLIKAWSYFLNNKY